MIRLANAAWVVVAEVVAWLCSYMSTREGSVGLLPKSPLSPPPVASVIVGGGKVLVTTGVVVVVGTGSPGCFFYGDEVNGGSGESVGDLFTGVGGTTPLMGIVSLHSLPPWHETVDIIRY